MVGLPDREGILKTRLIGGGFRPLRHSESLATIILSEVIMNSTCVRSHGYPNVLAANAIDRSYLEPS